jgi:hypothetical protein
VDQAVKGGEAGDGHLALAIRPDLKGGDGRRVSQ